MKQIWNADDVAGKGKIGNLSKWWKGPKRVDPSVALLRAPLLLRSRGRGHKRVHKRVPFRRKFVFFRGFFDKNSIRVGL